MQADHLPVTAHLLTTAIAIASASTGTSATSSPSPSTSAGTSACCSTTSVVVLGLADVIAVISPRSVGGALVSTARAVSIPVIAARSVDTSAATTNNTAGAVVRGIITIVDLVVPSLYRRPCHRRCVANGALVDVAT